jgi:Flp pilus assembly protein TadD
MDEERAPAGPADELTAEAGGGGGLRGWVLRIVDTIEELPMGLGRWLLVLAAIIVLRHFLEQVAGQQKTLYFLSYFVHYPLAYIAPLLTLSVVLSWLSGERIERVTKLMLFAWLLTLLPPLIDIAFARTRETPELIGYLLPKGDRLWPAFVNLMNPAYREFQGTTAGIRIEAALGCLLGAFYVHLKTRNVARAVGSLFVIYTTMFFFFALPPITVAVVRFLGGDVANVYQLLFAKASVHRAFVNATPFGLSDLSNALIDLIVIAPVLALWVRLYDRTRFAVLRSTIDPVQTPYHVLVTFGGLVLGARLLLNSTGLLKITHPFDVIALIGILGAAFFTSMAVVALRRMTAGDVDAEPEHHQHLLEVGLVSFSFATLMALSVSYVALTHVLAVLAVYYLYYTPPFRLARFPLLAGFMVGGATVFLFLLGYSGYAGGAAALWLPPAILVTFIVVPVLVLTGRDLWETSPALREGAWNLSTTLGEKKLRVLLGVLALVASLLPAVFLKMPVLLIPGAVVGVVGGAAALTRPPGSLPGTFAVLAFALVIAGYFANATDSVVLREQLANTSFAEAARTASSFEMVDPESGTEVARYLREGLERFRRGDFEGASESYRDAVEADPEDPQAYLGLGSVYLRLERLGEAGRAFRRAIAITPDDPMAHVGLGQTLKLSGDPDGAIASLNRALEIDPESTDAAYTLSLVHMDQGDLVEEFEALKLTVMIDPRHSLAQSRLADMLLANGQYRDAIASLRAVLSGRTPVEHVHTRLAEAYYELGDLEMAEAELRKEIVFRPRSPAPRANLGRLLAEMGRTSEARAEFEGAIALTEDPRFRERLEAEIAALGD